MTNQIISKILNDIKIDLKDEFDLNFERKAFFDKKWKERAFPYKKGTLMNVTGNLRKSISAEIDMQQNAVKFTSALPYSAVHNEGLRAGRGKGFLMPERRFIGDSTAVRKIITDIINKHVEDHCNNLAIELQAKNNKK